MASGGGHKISSFEEIVGLVLLHNVLEQCSIIESSSSEDSSESEADEDEDEEDEDEDGDEDEDEDEDEDGDGDGDEDGDEDEDELIAQNVQSEKGATWCWQENDGRWIEYDTKSSNIGSEDIEQEFQRGVKNKVFHARKYLYKLDFSSMIQTNMATKNTRRIRRVNDTSTTFSVQNVQSVKGVTWSWKENDGRWINYGIQGADGGITTEEIENAFQKQEEQIVFHHGRFMYIIKFADMQQMNLTTQKRRDIKREPNHPSQPSESPKLPVKKHSLLLSIPPNWNRSQISLNGFQLVPLGQQHSEYSMVRKLFTSTINKTLQKVSRIQNVELWENFTRKKKWMSHKRQGEVEERFLFHGTSSSSITGICTINFDMRLYGKNGTALGAGVYFAKNAAYSDRYVTESNCSKQMFLARVLVGEFVRGDATYRRPPEKTPDIPYDSCVDNVSNPQIFVIFDKDQMYPEYLLEYEKE
uniref:protein mono-ADP-ribosyltransferase PARP11-like isoform X2 n=1 Tax=Myxine glutinosa TaxID=7769 RepID=UPI00358DF70B